MQLPNTGRTVKVGDILIKNSAVLPDTIVLEADSTVPGWAPEMNRLKGPQLERELTKAGWTFFYMAGAIRTNAYGFEPQVVVARALERLIACVKIQNCNCLEIDNVTMRSRLGVPYVKIAGHARHIQKGIVFSGQ
jgi:hypothetical protein